MHIRHFYALAVILIGLYVDLAIAKDFPVAARLFIGNTQVDPKDLNTELKEAQSLKEVDTISQMGIEATHSVFKYLNWGFRYTKRYVKNEELVDNPSTDYAGELNQDSVLLLVRIPFIRSNILRADFFGGVGGSNTTFKIKSAGQDGEITRKESKDWYATPYTSAGGSVAIGYKKFYLVVEGGVETNKVDKFKRIGNVNSNVDTIDLSGSYFTVGLLFDGLSGSSK